MAATYMWSLVVFAACFYGAFADPIIENPVAFKNASWEKCQKQENVPDEVMREFYFFTTTERLKDYKCVVKCVQDDYGFYDEDGKLKVNLLEKIIKGLWKDPEVQQQLMAVIRACKNSDSHGTHPCQKNFDHLDCFITGINKGNINVRD